MSRVRFRKLFAVAALLIAGAMGLSAAELVVRVYVWSRGWTSNCYAAHLSLFRPHPQLGYDLRPAFRLRSGVYQVSINSFGLRGPEVSRGKPAGVQRIAILGGSAAFGYLVNDGQEAARLLERLLRSSGTNVEVLNGGVPGYNLFQSVPQFKDRVAPLEPDVVIAYLGWNDLAYITSDEPEADRFRVRPIAPVWDRLLSQSTLYGLVAHRLIGSSVHLPPSDLAATAPTATGRAQFRKNLESLAQEAKNAKARLILCAQATAARPEVSADLKPVLHADPSRIPAMIGLGEWLRAELRKFAEENNIVFLDANESIPPTREWLADYVHLTRAGEERLAQTLFAFLSEQGTAWSSRR